MDPHRLSELRSLAYHRAIASRLREEPALLERALRRVEAWLVSGEVHPEYARQWRALLESPIDELCALLERDDEHACTLRSVTPFAGAIDPRTRWQVWRTTRDEVAG